MIVARKQLEPDPRRVWWEDKDCERMNRNELNAMKWLLAMLCTTKSAQEALEKRMECIPGLKQRMNMTMGGFRAITLDLIGTITSSQAKMLEGVMKDYDVRIMPKAMPNTANLIVSRDDMKMLLDHAREKCKDCTEDGNTCRKCDLYKFLEHESPLNEYDGNEMICPYSLAEWED